ncbi:MAG: hypothetical protein ACOC2F_06635 [Bacteroidota bacterium]
MQNFLRNLGLFLILAGFILLVVSVIQGMTTNTLLLVSGSLVVGGLLLYIILNRVIEE